MVGMGSTSAMYISNMDRFMALRMSVLAALITILWRTSETSSIKTWFYSCLSSQTAIIVLKNSLIYVR